MAAPLGDSHATATLVGDGHHRERSRSQLRFNYYSVRIYRYSSFSILAVQIWLYNSDYSIQRSLCQCSNYVFTYVFLVRSFPDGFVRNPLSVLSQVSLPTKQRPLGMRTLLQGAGAKPSRRRLATRSPCEQHSRRDMVDFRFVDCRLFLVQSGSDLVLHTPLYHVVSDLHFNNVGGTLWVSHVMGRLQPRWRC